MRLLPTFLLLAAGVTSVTATSLDDEIARAFVGRSGSAIILDIGSGRIIAAYRPEIAAGTLARPGSIIKPFTVATLIDHRAIIPYQHYACTRRLEIAGRNMDCSHARPSHPFDASDAIAYSCNSWVTHFAVKLNVDDLAHALRSYGFANKTNLLAGEVQGDVQTAPDREVLALQSIGEDAIVTTPLAVAASYAKLARRVNEPHFAPVLDGLRRCVTEGTGLRARSGIVEIAGKTGTALAVSGARRQAWFAGFAPALSPQVAFVVFLEEGTGANDAAPVARAVIDAWADRR